MREVEAVKGSTDIATVKDMLNKHGGEIYKDIWSFGINTALRISDLITIRFEDVVGREFLVLIEGKTKKERSIKLNKGAVDVIQRRYEDNPKDTYLFQAKGNRATALAKPIDRSTVARKFQEIGEIVKIPIGTHSMRKTRGYAEYTRGTPIEKICKMLNHSAPAITLRYIGIEKQDIHDSYDDLVL